MFAFLHLRRRTALALSLAASVLCAGLAWSHGHVTPQAVDTSKLP